VFRIQHLLEAGLVEYWKKQAFPQLQCQRGAYAEARSISLGDIVGAFLLLAIGIIAALCVTLVERFCYGFLRDMCIEVITNGFICWKLRNIVIPKKNH
jgi:hypothetical protein